MEKSRFWGTVIISLFGCIALMFIPKVGVLLGLIGLLLINYCTLILYFYYFKPEFLSTLTRTPHRITWNYLRI
jgi:hypothetical protein